jgi:hypothetical protein
VSHWYYEVDILNQLRNLDESYSYRYEVDLKDQLVEEFFHDMVPKEVVEKEW